MSRNKLQLTICSYSALFLLLLVLLVPGSHSAWFAAVLTSAVVAVYAVLVKKRAIHRYLKRQVLYIMLGFAGMYVLLYYLSAVLKFGFVYAKHPFSASVLFGYILPIAISIVASEVFRSWALAQHDRQATVLSYLICLLTEILILSTIPQITSFNKFMDVVAMTFLPAVVANFVYHYLSRRYGAYPNMAYRLVIGLFSFVIPYASAIPDSLYSIFKLLYPIAIYLFIDALYEKKRRFALARKSVLTAVAAVLVLVIGVSVTMLISCQFRYGLLVVGSPSMTGEVNKGDAIIFDEYTGQPIEEGQVIVFEKNGSTIIHRVVAVDIINDEIRYTTKGDANENNDVGYITNANLVGVVDFKIPYIGYPTVWIRSLFS